MPDSAPVMKVESTKKLGANVELVNGAYDDAHDRAVQLVEETGATFIHPYDDDFVIAGQATIGLEILDQLEGVENVIVPIGGGGLISGIAFAIKSLKPSVKIFGVQASGAPSMFNSFKAHQRESLESVSTFADGIAVKNPGETTFEIISKYVDDIVCVSEDEIAAAILALIEKQKLIAEGAGAVSVAAAMFKKLPVETLLCETDAPYQYLKGEICTLPYQITSIYDEFYRLRCENYLLTKECFFKQLNKNFESFLQLENSL